MKIYKLKIYSILYYISFIVLIIISISLLMRYLIVYNKIQNDNYNLKEHGICIIKNIISEKEISEFKQYISNDKSLYIKERIIKSNQIQHKIEEQLGPSYTFHDYMFLIQKSQIHTCHRDYNGDFFNKNQKYPSYTMIIYLENMDKCLEVIPKSHESFYSHAFNITDHTETIVCKAGDAVLFNGNLIHTGSINDRENNIRIQLKISHIEDHETLHFYQNYNKVLNKTNPRPKWMKQLQKHFSCQFPIIGTYSQSYDFKTVENSSPPSPIIQFFKSVYSKIMYGDTHFYELDDISK